MFFVYLLRSEKDKSFYIGFAEDLKARIKKHEMGLVSSTKKHFTYEIDIL
ncbi:MAG: GIY-YIG nuclease family protein [Patescibacteria group bacterium]